MIWNSFKKGFILLGSFLAVGNMFFQPFFSKNTPLPQTPESLAQAFMEGWQKEDLSQLLPLLMDELYLDITEEHQFFSRYQTLALLQRYFDQISNQQLVLEKAHANYLLFRQTSFVNGKSEQSRIFLGYQRSQEVLKIVRVEKE